MGSSNSKSEKNEALLLCKRRKRFIKQAIDSRYALSAAHLSYIQSLRNVGVALRRFAEAEILIESSLSTSATDLDKTPSHSSYPSPAPSHNAESADSPLHNDSPSSTALSSISFMRSSGPAAVTLRMSPSLNSFVEDESLTFPVPPPPPPPEAGSSWDFFDPISSLENRYNQNFDNLMNLRQFREESTDHSGTEEANKWDNVNDKQKEDAPRGTVNSYEVSKVDKSTTESVCRSGTGIMSGKSGSFDGNPQNLCRKGLTNDSESREPLEGASASDEWDSKRERTTETQKEQCPDMEDPSEFITHRAKDFLSSIKDIEHRFFRASESGREVSRMLEANKIQLSFSEAKGKSSESLFHVACHLICCASEHPQFPGGHLQRATQVITWKRTTSSQSSSSRNPQATTSRDDDEYGSDFIEEFCMIAGSHSSTLDRLYAWERKLHDEVKASESIRKEYDKKCNLLRQQFAKDLRPHTIDKTRSIVKDLHSQIKVTIQAVDFIAKRIEKLRDNELLPQLIELIQGFIRMWKAMLECHHVQYITISLAYHAQNFAPAVQSESQREVFTHLQQEIGCFHSSLANWFESHKSYVEALNSWLQASIFLQPQERSRRRMPFSPTRAGAPPIFVLCRDWLSATRNLPYNELSEAIKGLLSDLHCSHVQQVEEHQKEISEVKDENETGEKPSTLSRLQSNLTRALDRLTKFAEASLKMYEDVRHGTEAAGLAYANGKKA